METRQEFGPSRLVGIEFLCGHEIFKSAVVRVDAKALITLQTLQLSSPHFQRPDDCEKFLIVSFVVALWWVIDFEK